MQSLLLGLGKILRRNGKSEKLKMVLAIGVVTVVAIGVAAPAVSIGQDILDPAMRRLSFAPGLTVAPAFGGDDEDCIIATRRQVLPDGRVHIHRELICQQ